MIYYYSCRLKDHDDMGRQLRDVELAMKIPAGAIPAIRRAEFEGYPADVVYLTLSTLREHRTVRIRDLDLPPACTMEITAQYA